MTYQGHLADGSSVQKHSAGAFYPYVLQLRGDHFAEIIGPGVPGVLRFETIDEAQRAAMRLVAVRENEDAWAFELERLMTFAGQKRPVMAKYAEIVGAEAGALRWADMSKLRRAWSLLALGACFNAAPRPAASCYTTPTFATLAQHWLGETR